MLKHKINFIIEKYSQLFPVEDNKILSTWNKLNFFSTNKKYRELSIHNLKKSKKNDLIQLCKKYKKNINKVTTKQELINILKPTDKEHFRNAFDSLVTELSSLTNELKEYTSSWENMEIDVSKIKYYELERYKLISYSKDELVSLCKDFDVTHIGKKNILIERLSSLSNIKVNRIVPIRLKNDKKYKKDSKSKTIYLNKLKLRPTFSLSLFRDDFYYIKNHKINGKIFLFNKDKYIVNKYINNKIEKLDKHDIIDCQIYKLSYIPPVNLDELIN